MYDEIQFIMATLGYKMNNATEIQNDIEKFHISRNGINAYGIYNGEKFEVLESSEIDFDKKSSAKQQIQKQRDSAYKNGDIVEEKGKFILKVSMSFSSPSTAASFVLGYSANGWVEWKNKDGKTLDEIYRK